MSARRKRSSQVLTAQEVSSLLARCGRGRTGHRNRALLALLWRCGLRCSEALGLRPGDLELGTGRLYVSRAKGSRPRTVGVDALTLGLLERWLLERKELLGPRPRAPLLCTLRGGELASRYVRQLLPRLAARAGLTRRVHPHALRHSFAVELAREGVPMPEIQAALGHRSLSTTSIYLAHFGALEVVATMSARLMPSAAERPARPTGPTQSPRPGGPEVRKASTPTPKAAAGPGSRRAPGRRAAGRAPAGRRR